MADRAELAADPGTLSPASGIKSLEASRRQQTKSERLSITAVILTFNEAIHIERCLQNAFEIAERAIVVDSYSTDDTVAIAHRSAGGELI